MTNTPPRQKFLWIDLEMTGLNPETQRIIEVGIIITDENLNELARYESIINQPESVLEAAEEWPKQNMTELFAEVREARLNETQVVADIVALIGEHFTDANAMLAGNSIHQDRRFIRRWWPEVESLLHYRMLDVSSFKVWIEASRAQSYEKQSTHRALQDIEESIAELRWSLDKLKD